MDGGVGSAIRPAPRPNPKPPGLATPGRLALALAALLAAPAARADGKEEVSAWRTLADGVEYATFTLATEPESGDGLLHVVRIDPSRAELRALVASAGDGKSRTAQGWLKEGGLAVAINAGMYQSDGRSNVGYFRSGAHQNNARWNAYRSAFAFGPRRGGIPAAVLVDLDPPDSGRSAAAQAALDRDYDTVIQNLRLIKGTASGVWSPGAKRWSEAAIAEDDRGHILFLFARTPLSMSDWIERVLALPLHVARAMHVEGGPLASLSIRAGDLSLDLAGSFESGFSPYDRNARQAPIPNVIGVRASPNP